MANYRSNYSKKLLIIAGAAKLGVIALTAALVITGVVGLSGKAYGSDVNMGGASAAPTSAPTTEPTPTQTPTPEQTTPSSGGNSPIVGMWRSEIHVGAPYTTVGVVFFNADGTYSAIRFREDRFYGEKGEYSFNGNSLEIYNLSRFQIFISYLSNDYPGDLRKCWDIIGTGTRSDVLEIIDLNHSIWQHYSGKVDWMDADSLTRTIKWIDDTHMDYTSGLINPFELVP